MGIFSGAWNVTTNALSAAEFGTKGIIAGAGVGLGTELLINNIGDEDDKNSVGTQFKRGFVSGSVASAFSTFQEQYAFKYPNKVQALTSINTTTSANSMIDIQDKLLNVTTHKNAIKALKDTYKERKKNKNIPKEEQASFLNTLFENSTDFIADITDISESAMRPQNLIIDLAKQGMISNTDISAATGKIFNPFSVVTDDTVKPFKELKNDKDAFTNKFKKEFGFTPGNIEELMNKVDDTVAFTKEGLFQYSDLSNADKSKRTMKELANMYKEGIINSYKNGNNEEGTSPWLTINKDVTIPEKHFDNTTFKEVEINAADSMEERIGKYLDRNREDVQSLLDDLKEFANFSKEINIDKKQNRYSGIYDVDELIKYIKTINPGALGTHNELSKGENNTKRKIISALYEEKSGAPLWAMATQKQIDSGAATLTDTINVMRGDKKISIPANEYKKLEGDKFISRKKAIEGGSKGMRALAMLGDIALGGLMQGIMFAAPALITAPFRNGGSDKRINTINSNNAINPVY